MQDGSGYDYPRLASNFMYNQGIYSASALIGIGATVDFALGHCCRACAITCGALPRRPDERLDRGIGSRSVATMAYIR